MNAFKRYVRPYLAPAGLTVILLLTLGYSFIKPNLEAAFLAAMLTMVGIWITSITSDERARGQLEHDAVERAKQLAHDAKENERDRQLDLRRDVFLGAIEANGNMAAFVGGAARIVVSSPEFTAPFQAFSTAALKVVLVANPDTGGKVSKLLTFYTRFMGALHEYIEPVQRITWQIERQNKITGACKVELERITAESKKERESGVFNVLRNAALASSLADAHRAHEETTTADAAAALSHLTATLQYTKFMAQELPRMNDLQRHVILALKSEFQPGVDLTELDTQLQEQTRLALATLHEFLNKYEHIA